MTSEIQTNLRRPLSSKPFRRRATPYIVCIIVITVTLANQLVLPPLSRLVELTVCRDFYQKHDPSIIDPDGNIEEALCKNNDIQTKVAELIGLVTTLGMICELLVTLPLGYLSDQYGRPTILLWNITAQALAYSWMVMVGYFYNTFSINIIIIAPFFYLLGGSTSVMSANLMAIVADVSANDVQRTKLFGFIQSASQVINLLAPALAAFTMEMNLYLPFWIGIGSFIISFPAVTLLEDTRHPVKTIQVEDRAITTNGEGSDYQDSSEEDLLLAHNERNGNPESTISRTKSRVLEEGRAFYTLFKKSRNIQFALVAFLVTTLAKNNLNILLQYVSKRYGWKLSSAAYLFSVKAGVNLLLFIAIIPLSLNWLTEYRNVSKNSANIWGARISLLLLGFGSLAIGLSDRIWMLIISFVIYDLGWGFNLFMLSVVTHAAFEVLDESHTASLYSAVAFVETVGSAIGAGTISGMWFWGINIGGVGLGLPFWVCAALYGLVGIAIWKIRS